MPLASLVCGSKSLFPVSSSYTRIWAWALASVTESRLPVFLTEFTIDLHSSDWILYASFFCVSFDYSDPFIRSAAVISTPNDYSSLYMLYSFV